jgi:hypothetical protein
MKIYSDLRSLVATKPVYGNPFFNLNYAKVKPLNATPYFIRYAIY